jgi:hypothetical protein
MNVTEPAVQALIAAINDGDREAFSAALTPDATMSDDGTDRNLTEWAEREIFTVHGHLDVISAEDGGQLLACGREAQIGREIPSATRSPRRTRPGNPNPA